jgi:hypothetical protein
MTSAMSSELERFNESVVTKSHLCQQCEHLCRKLQKGHSQSLGRLSSFSKDCILCNAVLESADIDARERDPLFFIDIFQTNIILQDLNPAVYRGGLMNINSWSIRAGVINSTRPIRAGVEDLDFEPVAPSLWTSEEDRGETGLCNRWLTPLAPVGNVDKMFFAHRLIDQIDFSFVKAWIRSCSKEHHLCKNSATTTLSFPIRVIDCIDRTVIWRQNQEPYLTLSYVWGDPATRGEFILELSASTPLLKDLPSLIEDAIRTTTLCGYRYLWIDFYCINQQDKTEVEQQISHMGNIYSLSDATIMAATCLNPSQPLPGVCKGSRPPSRGIEIHGRKYVWIKHPRIENSHWNSRGWTYQEAVLARRRIMFFEDRLYLECNMSIELEGINMPSDMPLGWNPNFLFTQSKLDGEDPSSWVYFHFRRYVVRTMSFESDILRGFTGILEAHGKKNPGFISVGGIPFAQGTNEFLSIHTLSERFAAGLTWSSSKLMERRQDFPSWSWTGWRKPDMINLRIWSNDAVNHPRLKIEVEIEAEKIISLDELTLMESSSPIRYIHITAPIINIHLSRVHSRSEEWTIDPSDDLYSSFKIHQDRCYLHKKLDESAETLSITGIILDWYRHEGTILLITGLNNGSSNDVVERIGTARINRMGIWAQSPDLVEAKWHQNVKTIRLG